MPVFEPSGYRQFSTKALDHANLPRAGNAWPLPPWKLRIAIGNVSSWRTAGATERSPALMPRNRLGANFNYRGLGEAFITAATEDTEGTRRVAYLPCASSALPVSSAAVNLILPTFN